MDEDPINVIELRNIGGRKRNERSRALPARQYGDPADSIEFESEREAKRELEELWLTKRIGPKKGSKR